MLQYFTEREYRERFALNNILSFLKRKDYDFNYTISPVETSTEYDLYFSYSKDGFIKKRYYCEAKIRTQEYTNYVLEFKKLKSLQRLIRDNNLEDDTTDILYINFTPNRTYVWNISKLINTNKLKLTDMVMNKQTSNSRMDKINKKVYLLEVEDATIFDYIYSEKEYLESIKPKPSPSVLVKPKGIFD